MVGAANKNGRSCSPESFFRQQVSETFFENRHPNRAFSIEFSREHSNWKLAENEQIVLGS